MSHRAKNALLCASVLLAGGHFSVPAMAADEHERSRAEGRPEARPAGRSAPRPDVGAARPAFDGRGQVLDQRYNHGPYYPPAGTVLNSLPDGYRPYFRSNDRYYFNSGVWHAPRGPGFVVVRPPVGLVISGSRQSSKPPISSSAIIGRRVKPDSIRHNPVAVHRKTSTARETTTIAPCLRACRAAATK